jgi:hypothetical protein
MATNPQPSYPRIGDKMFSFSKEWKHVRNVTKQPSHAPRHVCPTSQEYKSPIRCTGEGFFFRVRGGKPDIKNTPSIVTYVRGW